MKFVDKRLGTVKQLDAAEHTFSFVANSGQMDRSGEILVPEGCDSANWMNNPLVLWAHDDYSLPVGKGLSLTPVPGEGLVGKGMWASGENQFAATVEAMYNGGFLNGFSVRFLPKRWEDYGEDSPERKSGLYRTYHEWELLELSVVAIPCDPLALRKAFDGGDRVELARMVKMATEINPDPRPNEATKAALAALGLETTDDLVTILEPYLKRGTELGLGADELLAKLKEKLMVEKAADPDAEVTQMLEALLARTAEMLHDSYVRARG